MYAVVEIAGQQFMVEKGKQILTPKLNGNVGESIEIDQVLLTSDNDDVKVGSPIVKDAKVQGTIVEFERGKKVIVFKKKRRKGYQVKNGHRQGYTRLQIDDIIVGG